jgi:hypothetical protein
MSDSTTIEALRAMLEEARRERDQDEEYWAREMSGQDSEEAEESGRLCGYAEGLADALRLLDAHAR